MKNVLIEALTRLVCRYFNDLKSGGVECRLVLPALTEEIAIGLQEALINESLPSYLVVPRGQDTDATKRWIRAEGVTSVRQGDMIVIVWPGEMSRIQDSVIGAGGAMRNFAFNDEWPWIDTGNEYFQFDGPVLKELFARWAISPENAEAFMAILCEARDTCRDSMLRGVVFLDRMLGRFDPQMPESIEFTIDRLLFHLGIPHSTEVLWSEKGAATRFFSNVRRVVSAINVRLKDTEGKQELLSRIPEIEPDKQIASQLENSFDSIVDLYTTRGDDRQEGLLSLHGCWTTFESWNSWSLERLQRLLDVAPAEENVNIKAAVSVSSGIVSEDGKAVVLIEGGDIQIDISYEGLSRDVASTEIRVLDRTNELYRGACTGTSGELQVKLYHDDLYRQGATGKKKTLRIIANRGQTELATARIAIVPCGPNQPLVTIMDPGFKVYFGNQARNGIEPGEGAEKVEVTEPVRFTVVSWDSFVDGEVEVDDEPVELKIDDQNAHILRFPSVIDPGSAAAGLTNVWLRTSGLETEIDVEAKDIVRGEFTLERELIMQLSRMSEGSGRRGVVNRLVDIFLGKITDSYSGLGGMDDTSRYRVRLASFFEEDDFGRPIVANLLKGQPRAVELICYALAVCDRETVPSILKAATIRGEVEALTGEYAKARRVVLDVIRNGARRHPQWPDYALLPIFVEARHAQISEAIFAFLKTYLDILAYLENNLNNLSFPELFRLACVDCVVHWDDAEDDTRQQIILIGPWHPTVVAKRFMVQSALVSSGRRYLGLKNERRSHVLALLLDQVNSLRWFSAPATDGVTFESYYVSSTSDPGWQLAMMHNVVGGPRYLEFTTAVRRSLGLEIGLLPSSREQVARGYLQDFFNAYPTRRAISVVADQSYSPVRLAESAQALLYDGDRISSVGRQLPGGVHICVPNAEDLAAQEWREPPVCLYSGANIMAGDKRFNDIHLLSPGQAKSSRDSGNRVSLPRGGGLFAAFCSPVKEVGAWSNGILNSRAFERDIAISARETLGDMLTQACQKLASMPKDERIMSWQADLPPSLDHLWTVIPGNHVDPAVFVKYVTNAARRGESTALWDYSMSLTGALNSYFVLSRIPQSVSYELNKSPVLEGKPIAPAVLGELGRVGMALGSESLRSGNKALGVIGVVAAVRLFLPDTGDLSPIRNDNSLRGFLLPVDSFREILGGWLDSGDVGQRQRADLIAVQLGLLDDGTVGVSCCAIECKYSSTGFGKEQVAGAMLQAQATLRRLQELLDVAQINSGIPERLAVVSLISFGLRLSQEQLEGSETDHAELEAKILQRVLDGKLRVVQPKSAKIVIVTDCTASSASWSQAQGLAITLGPGHWPGVSESPELTNVRARLSLEFTPLFEMVCKDPDQALSDSRGQSGAGMPAERGGNKNERDTSSGVGLAERRDDPSDHSSSRLIPGLPETPALANDGKTSPATIGGALRPLLLGTGENLQFFYDPQSRDKPLDNYNVMITGSSGKGKTQLIKTVVSRLREQGRNVVLLDFKNDFASDENFVSNAGLVCQFVTFDGLPFNPLIPVPLRKPGSSQEYLAISEHINGLVDTFKKAFGLGDQQEVAVKNAIRDCFEERGIPSRGAVPITADLDYPDFNDVGDRLRNANPNAYNRLDPLFDLGIFPPRARSTRFDSMLHGSTVVDLSQIQSDKIKNAVAKILVMSAHRYYNAREHSGHLRQFFVFDEAHRVLDSEFLLQFVRECRAYGVGVLLSSQYPTDFPADVSASMNTKILHGNGGDRDRVRDISKLVGGSLPDDQIMQLSLFQAIVTNAQYSPTAIKTIGYSMMLVLDAIRSAAGIARDELRVVGLDPARLNVGYLISALMGMGLVEETNGKLYCK